MENFLGFIVFAIVTGYIFKDKLVPLYHKIVKLTEKK
jgi:hypothetical protein